MFMPYQAETLKPGVFLRTGHRGAAGLAPENTMPSFQKAVDLGVDLIELDVQATADGQIVVLHDPTVDRTTDGTGGVCRLSFEEVKRLDAGFRFGGPAFPFREKGVRIPLLEEVLDAFPETGFTIEIKSAPHPDFMDRLAAIVKTQIRGEGGSRIILAAEAEEPLNVLRKTLPAVPTNFCRNEVRRFYFMSKMGVPSLFRSPGRVFQVPVSNPINDWLELRVVTRRFVRHAHRLGRPVQVWTINDPQDMRNLIAMGVDGITTDRPDVLNDVLRTLRTPRTPPIP